ncbi:hypothetical protein AAG596_07885 [Citromicrobium bathyomarinum]|uniref:hypothetical protein n=1 Tax=Citromicrobium bathyomarinum TaxID=72174 RepID=UPI00315A83E5
MSDYEGYPVVTAQVGGRRRRLSQDRQWRAAIHDRSIDRDTLIEYEDAPGHITEMPARDCSALVPLLDEILGPEPEPVPEPVAEDEAEQSQEDAPPPTEPEKPILDYSDAFGLTAAEKAPQSAEAGTAAANTTSQTPPSHHAAAGTEGGRPAAPARTGNAGSPDDGGNRKVVFAGLALLAVVFVGWIISLSGEESDYDSTDYYAEDASEMMEDSAEPALPLGTTYYAKTQANYRNAPEGASEGTMPRGMEFNAVTASSNSEWLQITRGPFAGRFIKASTVSTDRPPDLDTSTADDFYVIRQTSVYSSPNRYSQVVEELPFPTKVTIAGSVGGGFAEALIDGLPVGYVEWDDLGGEGGRGPRRWFRIVNDCGKTVNAVFNIQENGTYNGFDGYWTFAPNASRELVYTGYGRVYTDSVFNYWLNIGDDIGPYTNVRDINGDTASVGGKTMGMKRIVPLAVSDDEYVLRLCG